jgi:hypothetical protein
VKEAAEDLAEMRGVREAGFVRYLPIGMRVVTSIRAASWIRTPVTKRAGVVPVRARKK